MIVGRLLAKLFGPLLALLTRRLNRSSGERRRFRAAWTATARRRPASACSREALTARSTSATSGSAARASTSAATPTRHSRPRYHVSSKVRLQSEVPAAVRPANFRGAVAITFLLWLAGVVLIGALVFLLLLLVARALTLPLS